MKNRRSSFRCLILVATAAAAMLGFAPSELLAQPTTFVWDGSEAVKNWNVDNNWVGGAAPANGSFINVDYSGVPNTDTYTSLVGPTGLKINQFTLGGSAPATMGISASFGSSLIWGDTGYLAPSIVQNTVGAGTYTFAIPQQIFSGAALTITGTSTSQVTSSSVISGGNATSNVVKSGSVTWVSSALHTFAGGVTLNGGSIVVGADSVGAVGAITSGPLGTGVLNLNGGAIRTNAGNPRTILNNVEIGGDVQLGTFEAPQNLTFAAPVLLTGTAVTRTISLGFNSANSATLAGVVSDGGNANGLTVSNVATRQGTLVLGGGASDSAANTYTGLTTVSGSATTLLLDKADGTNAIAGNLSITNGIVRLGRSNQISNTSALVFTATTGTFDLNGNSETIGSLAAASAGGLVTTTAAGSSTLTVDQSTNTSFAGSIQNGAGTVQLIKSGSGQLLLSGANTHGGGTVLNAGALVASSASALGVGSVTLNGGTIRTTDSTSRAFTNAVNIGGDVAIGIASTQSTLSLNGATTLLGSGATRTVTVNSNTLGNRNPVTFGGAIGDGGNSNGLTVASAALHGTGFFSTVVLGAGAADAAANTYTGLTTLNGAQARLLLDKADGTSAVAGDLQVSSGRLNFARANQIADTSDVTVSGGSLTFASDFSTAVDGFDETIGSLTTTGGLVNTNPSGAATGNTVAVTGEFAMNGGTLRVNPGSTMSAETVTVSASGLQVGGTLEVGSGGLVFQQGASGFLDLTGSAGNADGVAVAGGLIQLGGNVTVNANVGNTDSVRITQGGGAINSWQVDLNGATRTFDVSNGAAADDFLVNPNITDSGVSGKLVKTGAGTMVINSPLNTSLNREFEVNAGVLKGGANDAFGTGSLLVDGAGATLDLNNATLARSYSNAVTVNEGNVLTAVGSFSGTLASLVLGDSTGMNDAVLSAGGSGIGRFNTTGGLTLNSDSQFSFTLNSDSLTADLVSGDVLALNGGSIVFADLGTAVLGLGTSFTVMSGATSFTGSFGNLANGQQFILGSNVFEANYGLNDLTITVVPEPGTWLLVAFGAVVVLIHHRRRRA